MTRGSLGIVILNHTLQQAVNPASEDKGQLIIEVRIFKVGAHSSRQTALAVLLRAETGNRE